jgi:arginyl-tRNA synthetase
MHSVLEKAIKTALEPLGIEADFSIEAPADFSHGDYATNAALVAGKKLGKNPKEVAEAIAAALRKEDIKNVEKIEIAGPGFINFFLSREFFAHTIKDVL